jgi:hypothetical protein
MKLATEMTGNPLPETNHPIDVVIAWVDGNDPKLTEKRNQYLGTTTRINISSGAHATRFASVNEIRYCVLSILRFAPFVRNIFILTDGQDPNLYDDIKKYFPDKLKSVKIVDHKEIFEGFEEFLPTFNSISIGNMIWRIKGLSENFAYFNDDLFLIRKIEPEDMFVKGKPVLRGRWVQTPLGRILWNHLRRALHKYLAGNPDFHPRASFHMGQWRSAFLLGYKFRYFTNSHTPHMVGKKIVEDFLNQNRPLLEKNLSFRFRNYTQFTFISLSNHLQLLSGNELIAKPDLAYLQPFNRYKGYLKQKLRFCEKNEQIKFVCVQSLEMCEAEDQKEILSWMDSILNL